MLLSYLKCKEEGYIAGSNDFGLESPYIEGSDEEFYWP
jgi:hypothetical protein